MNVRTIGWLSGGMVAVAAFAAVQMADAGGGTVQLGKTTLQESSAGSWKLFMTLTLPSPPAIPHQTYRFVFTPEVVYERTLVDGKSEPVMTRQPVVGQQPMVESLDVDFSDGSGKIWKGTKFDFSVTRARGYQAGEYKLQVKNSNDGNVGSPVRLILNGDNPVVDRRSMDFSKKAAPPQIWDGGTDSGIKAL